MLKSIFKPNSYMYRALNNEIYDLPTTTADFYMHGGASASDQTYYDQIPAHGSSGHIHNHKDSAEYSMISGRQKEKIVHLKTPAADTSNEVLVYSAVVRKDGKKTTVKTTAQI